MQISKENILSYCLAGIPSWKDVIIDNLNCERLLGMSNLTLAVEVCNRFTSDQRMSPTKIFLRVYPIGNNSVVNKLKEQAIFKYLSDNELGVRLLYQNSHYRIEEFVDGKALTIYELGNKYIQRKIGQLLSDYHHNLGLAEIVSQFESKTAFAERFLSDWLVTFRNNFSSYMEIVKLKENVEIMKKLEYLTTFEFEKEYRAMLKGLSKTEIVVGHNDIYELNILRTNSDKEQLRIIDYEYTNFNYRAIDLATLWIETTIDYSHPQFPFFKSYLSNKWDDEEIIRVIQAYLERDAMLKGIENVEEYVAKETPILYEEVKIAEPLVSAVWAAWVIIIIDKKIFDETKDFNIRYAMLRFGYYEKSKEAVLKMKLIH